MKIPFFNKRGKKVKDGKQCIGLKEFWDDIKTDYVKLEDNPEILAGIRKIATLISSMTIYLMSNTDKGDERIINELSRKVDINPCNCMTRQKWMEAIVMNLLLHGRGNAIVLPITRDGILEDLIPCPASWISFHEHKEDYGYDIGINGTFYDSSEVIHFTHNPDKYYPWKGRGITVSLKNIAETLKQADTTKKAFMKSKWKPSVIVKVDGLTEEFSSKAGRKKLLESYLETNEVGEPWLIPADQFAVEQIRPLSLSDLAIDKTVELDKKTVASLIGVPPFVLGVGKFNAEEWNNFISSTIGPIAIGLQQELTKKLLISPKWYWKFNVNSLYSYKLETLAAVYGDLAVRGIVTGNEVRDKINMSPMDGLDELVVLENYIPLSKIGDQKKLNQEEE